MSGSEFGIACTLSAVVYYIYDTVRLKQRLNDLRPGRSAAPHGGARRGNALHLMAVFDSVGDFYSFTNAIRERGYRMFNTEKQRICALPGAGGTLLTRRKRRICS